MIEKAPKKFQKSAAAIFSLDLSIHVNKKPKSFICDRPFNPHFTRMVWKTLDLHEMVPQRDGFFIFKIGKGNLTVLGLTYKWRR
jgi:hypothetical protein